MKRRFAFLVCQNRPGLVQDDEIFTSITLDAGKADAPTTPLRDDSGDSISTKSSAFAELTALYWMWKNLDADHYGFFHHRIWPNFAEARPEFTAFQDFSPERQDAFGWSQERIARVCQDHDIVAPPWMDTTVHGLSQRVMTNYELYRRDHVIDDLDLALRLIRERTPAVYPFVVRRLHWRRQRAGHVFVMRADRFRAYAQWLFDILFACEAQIDLAARRREPVLACLAEQLFPGYLDYVATTHGAWIAGFGVAYGQLDRPVLDGAPILDTVAAQQTEAPRTRVAERIHVTFAIDDNYTPHCAAALASLFAHLHPQQRLTAHILHDDSLSRDSQALLAALPPNPHVELDFVPVAAEEFERYPHNRPHISRATYYRLALHRLLPDSVDKTIYLDADIILADNIAKIWLDLGDHLAAAVADEGGVSQSRRLALPLSHAYFNAGVCLFNLKALRAMDADALYWRSFDSRREDINLQDQDILNIAFCGRTLRLPLRWNANGRLFRTNELDYDYTEAEAHEAALSPALIHYTDVHKPWLPDCPHPLTPLYWRWREAALAAQDKQKAKA